VAIALCVCFPIGFSAVDFSAIGFSAVDFSAIRFSAIGFSAIECIEFVEGDFMTGF